MFSFLIVGGTLFWISAIVLSIIIIATLHNEDGYGLAVAVTVVFCVAFYKMFLAISVAKLLWCIGAYLVAGAVWSVWRWYRHIRDKVDEAKAGEYIHENDLNPARRKGKISAWIAYWPFSVFWELTHNLFENIRKMCVGFYEKISSTGAAEIKAIQAAQEAERKAKK